MKLTKEQKAKLVNWIEWHELCSNGLRHINGGFTRVTNLRLSQTSTVKPIPKISFTLTLGEQCGGDSDHVTKYPNCEMFLPKEKLLSIINK
jgi:hypothetical protein